MQCMQTLPVDSCCLTGSENGSLPSGRGGRGVSRIPKLPVSAHRGVPGPPGGASVGPARLSSPPVRRDGSKSGSAARPRALARVPGTWSLSGSEHRTRKALVVASPPRRFKERFCRPAVHLFSSHAVQTPSQTWEAGGGNAPLPTVDASSSLPRLADR